MPGKHYTQAEKDAALALAQVEGIERAAWSTGIDPRTLRIWWRAADLPNVIDADEWEKLSRLAVAKTTRDVSEGRIKGVALATVAAIAKRNAAAPKTAAPPRTPGDELEGWIDRKYGPDADRALTVLLHGVEDEEYRQTGKPCEPIEPEPDDPHMSANDAAWCRAYLEAVDIHNPPPRPELPNALRDELLARAEAFLMGSDE